MTPETFPTDLATAIEAIKEQRAYIGRLRASELSQCAEIERLREKCARIAEATSPQDWSPEGMRVAIAENIRLGRDPSAPITVEQGALCAHGNPANACTLCHMWNQVEQRVDHE